MTNQPNLKSLLIPGRIVTFDHVPNGSYLSTGIRYRIEYAGKREVYFRNVNTGSGTADSWYMLRTISRFINVV